jgi:hypothetical protein
MIRFPAMTPARRARVVGVLAVVPAAVLASGLFVASFLAAARHPIPVITSSTAVPATPVITLRPADPSADTSPEFAFTDASGPSVRFTCWLDSGIHRDCTGEVGPDHNRTAEGVWQFFQLPPGPHCFYVYATGWAGRAGPVTRSCWTIGAAARNFTVGGNLATPLYPGISQRLNLTFTNPSSSPVRIPSGGIPARDITITSQAPGCASSNFAVTQGLASAITIPAGQHSPVSLSALRVPQGDWPVIEMIETGTNQDACQGAKLTLTYSGIEASQ